MFKTIAAATVAATANAAINADFISGVQTGAFIGSEVQFMDYSCPTPETSDKVDNYFNMYNMAKTMMIPKVKKSKTAAPEDEEANDMENMFEKIDEYADQIGVLVSVMDPSYEGGDFCQGLTVGYEARHVGQAAAVNFVKNVFNNKMNKDQ